MPLDFPATVAIGAANLTETSVSISYEANVQTPAGQSHHYRISAGLSDSFNAYYYRMIIDGVSVFEDGLPEVGPFESADEAIAAGRRNFRARMRASGY